MFALNAYTMQLDEIFGSPMMPHNKKLYKYII